MIKRVLTQLGRTASFFQTLIYLPLALDIAGKDCFLTLSALLVLYHTIHATAYLAFRNTRFTFISKIFGFLQNLAIPFFLLLCFNIYPGSDGNTSPRLTTMSNARQSFEKLLFYYQLILTWSTPTFVLLEGISTLLCIQSVGQISRYIIDVKSESYSFLFLVLSAVIYVCSAYFLFDSYAYAARESLSATLIGVSVTSVGFLSGIAISNRKGNVVETSLMMAYLSYNIYCSATAIIGFVSTTFGAGLDFLLACSSALPLPVFINLLYRVLALYGAGRIIVAIKRANAGFDYARRLSDEEPMVRMMTVLVSYSRVILISTYTHLLLINNEGHQVFWRWINVFVTLGLWGVELVIGREDGTSLGVLGSAIAHTIFVYSCTLESALSNKIGKELCQSWLELSGICAFQWFFDIICRACAIPTDVTIMLTTTESFTKSPTCSISANLHDDSLIKSCALCTHCVGAPCQVTPGLTRVW